MSFIKYLSGKTGIGPVLFAICGISLLLTSPAALAQPAAWPADSDWIHYQFDPDEGGIHNDNRDVEETFYAVDEGFLFLRMKMRGPAGWCSSCGQSFLHARYKWFFDTAGGDAHIQGGTVYDAEFMLFVEDYDDNRVGEITFIDDPANGGFAGRWNSTNPPRYTTNNPTPPPFPDWQREIGVRDATSYDPGDPAVNPYLGVPSSASGTGVGFRLFGGADVRTDGVYMDMYIDLALLGGVGLNDLRLVWLTDQENTNLDQAPCCDRPNEGDFNVVPVTGSIEIRKDTIPDSMESFAFSSVLGNFSLGDGDAQIFADLQPSLFGSIDVTETVPAGWSLGNIICSGDIDGGTTVDLGTGTASIDLDAGENIVCQFINAQQPEPGDGTIVIVKHAQPHGQQLFEFDGDLAPFSLVDDGVNSNLMSFTELEPGTYVVNELAPPAGWALTALDCSDSSGGTTENIAGRTATIVLAADEVVTCTFTNTQNGEITIVKSADPADDTVFSYSVNGDPGAFTLSDPSDPIEVVSVPPGVYTIAETLPGGWDLTGLTCPDPTGDSSTDLASATANINVSPGEAISCTFTNTQPGTLVIIKDSEPDDPQTFQYLAGLGDFSLFDDGTGTGNSKIFEGLNPQDVDLPDNPAYRVEEVVPDRWVVDNIVCDDPDQGSVVDVGAGIAYGDVDAGETVTCTFFNRPTEAVFNVSKEYADADGGPAVLISLTCDDPQVIVMPPSAEVPGGQSVPFTVSNFDKAGVNCSVNEFTLPAGYHVESRSPACDGSTMIDGEAYDCTITNAPNTDTIRVAKQYTDGSTTPVDVTMTCQSGNVDGTGNPYNTKPIAGGGFVSFTVTGFNQSTDASGQNTLCRITESNLPANYSQVSASQDCNQLMRHQDNSGQCTLLNGPNRATFVIEKIWNQTGDTDGIPVTGHLSCTGANQTQQNVVFTATTDAILFVYDINLAAGPVDCTVTEDVPANYSANYECNKGPCSDSDNQVAACFYPDVEFFGVYTCTITNRPRPANVTVTKTWVIEGADQGFDGGHFIVGVCDSVITGPTSDRACFRGACYAAVREDDTSAGSTDYEFTIVRPNYPFSRCDFFEDSDDSIVETDNGCGRLRLGAGDDVDCEIVNTVFFEGIPTLNQYGMAILALLMLGVGMIGFRRFV